MTFSKPLATRLAEAAKLTGSPLEKSYRNTIYCNSTLDQAGGVLTGKYCGNRWCSTCSRIRTALAVDRYMPILREWESVWFVTLTIPNVPADQLAGIIRVMLDAFTTVKRAIKRTDGVPFKAIRKLECTYNAKTDEYHPHFHCHVEGETAANLLRKRWLEHFPEADARAQDVQPARDDDSLLELFKYFTKLITKRTVISAVPLDIIFRSMQGHRVYQPVGFTLPKDAADDEAELELDKGTAALSRPGEEIVWEWSQAVTDWVDRDTGECLTGYEPVAKFRALLDAMDKPEVDDDRRRRLDPVEPINVRQLQDVVRRRMMTLENREPESIEYTSRALAKIFALTAKRAAALAARIVQPVAQQTLFSEDVCRDESAARSRRLKRLSESAWKRATH